MLLKNKDLTVRPLPQDALPVASGVEGTRSAVNARLRAALGDRSRVPRAVERGGVMAKLAFEASRPAARDAR